MQRMNAYIYFYTLKLSFLFIDIQHTIHKIYK